MQDTGKTSKEKPDNQWFNRLLWAFSGKLSAAGSGMAAQARQEVFIKWSNITKPKSLTILLRGGWIETIALFCTSENYSQIQQEVILKTTH